jgi:hypothetical protein
MDYLQVQYEENLRIPFLGNGTQIGCIFFQAIKKKEEKIRGRVVGG